VFLSRRIGFAQLGAERAELPGLEEQGLPAYCAVVNYAAQKEHMITGDDLRMWLAFQPGHAAAQSGHLVVARPRDEKFILILASEILGERKLVGSKDVHHKWCVAQASSGAGAARDGHQYERRIHRYRSKRVHRGSAGRTVDSVGDDRYPGGKVAQTAP